MTQNELNKLFAGKEGYLRGTDWSHHQKMTMDGDISDFDFFIHKLSEGASYVDPYCGGRIIRHASNKPCIVYHFMRTDTASGEQNFKNFQRNLKRFIGMHLGLAIDLETDTAGRYCPLTKRSKEEVKKFADLYGQYFTKPLIVYTGADGWKFFKECFKGIDVVPWIARWSSKEPTVKDWKFWQFSDKPYDLDVYKGTVYDMIEYLQYIL